MVVYSVKTLVLEYVYYTSDLISNGIRGIRIHHLGYYLLELNAYSLHQGSTIPRATPGIVYYTYLYYIMY